MIGYCGAHHQKFSFLLIYSALVVLYVFSNIVVFGVLAPKFQWLDANLVWIMCGYFSVLMVCALLLAYQIRLKEDHTTSRYVGNQMPPYYSSGGRFASLRRMGSLRAGYGRHLTRLFGSSGETSQPMANSTMIAAAGNEFGPIYMQHPLPAAYSGGGAMMVNPSQSIAMTTGSRPQQPVLQAGSSSSPQIACALNSPAIGGPTYSAYATYHHPHSSPQLHHQHPKPPYMGPPGAVVGGPAIPMDPPAYGGTYFGRQWQRMSSKRSSLRSSPAVYVNGSNVQYGACELKNLGPGRVNFL